MSEAPESWAQTERKKRDKRENSIIENWDNRILRKAQRAYESCGDNKLIKDLLKDSGFTTGEIMEGVNFNVKVKSYTDPDDIVMPNRIKKSDFKLWKKAGIRINKIEQLVNIPLFEELYPQHLLVRPFDFVILDRPLLSYKVAKQIAIDGNLKVSPEIKAEAWTRYQFQDQAYISEYNIKKAIKDEFMYNEEIQSLVESKLYKTKKRVKTIDWWQGGNKYIPHNNYYYTSNRIREIEDEIQTMVEEKMESSKYYSGLDVEYLNHRLLASTFGEEQKNCITSFFGIENNIRGPRISVLTGGPGTGKTHTIKEIIHHFQNYKPKAKILATALSGMAVTALQKSITSGDTVNIENVKIGTIHKTLLFATDSKHYDLVIIDETTMINMFIIKDILKMITKNPDVVIMFVGDVDQLPAIGAGEFFKDLIYSCNGSTVFRLTKNHRYSDELDATIKLLKDPNGSVPLPHSSYIPKAFKPNKFIKSIERLITKNYRNEEGWDEKFKKEWQFLSAQNSKLGGVSEINNFIQTLLMEKRKLGSYILTQNNMDFYVGDKVINTDNDYNRDPPLYNGQIGVISDYDYMTQLIKVDFYDGTSYVYNKKDFKYSVFLAYAVTVHKSQGSGFNNVVLVMSPEANMWPSMGKALLYTGASRVKETLYIYGSDELIRKSRKSPDNSFTGLFKHHKY